MNYDLTIKIVGKKLSPSKYVKYLGILNDPHLNWNRHSNIIASKRSRAIGMISKVRHYVSAVMSSICTLRKQTYIAIIKIIVQIHNSLIFISHLIYRNYLAI